jgi:TonB family protein
MLRRRQFRKSLILTTLGVLWVAANLRAQDDTGTPDTQPIILNQKQAEHMVLIGPKPEYPAVARVNYLQGRVQLKLTVDGLGKVTATHVIEGDAVLAASALNAVHHWLYRPLSTPNGPSGFVTLVRLKYFLNSPPSDLTPQRAERDFLRQVKPASALPPPLDEASGDMVRVRLLLDDQGTVDDVRISSSEEPSVEVPREVLRGWTFRPAHWGNLPVASYIEVSVPLGTQSIARATSTYTGP